MEYVCKEDEKLTTDRTLVTAATQCERVLPVYDFTGVQIYEIFAVSSSSETFLFFNKLYDIHLHYSFTSFL